MKKDPGIGTQPEKVRQTQAFLPVTKAMLMWIEELVFIQIHLSGERRFTV